MPLVSGVGRFWGALVHTFIGGPPTETKKIGVCQNEHRPRYRVQKYVTAIHRRKLVKNWGVECRRYSNGGAFDGSSIPGGVSPSPVRVGSGAPENFFDFVLRNVELYAFWTLEQGDSTATVIITTAQVVEGS